MYNLIGNDQRTYGPIPAEQVRQWVLERRAIATTLAQAQGSTEWKPLSNFPEFAPLFLAAPPLVTSVPPHIGDPRKSKIAAGLLGIFLGSIGVHRFYLGYTGLGVAQIIVTIVTCGYGGLWGFIEGILILCGTTITTDADGNTLKD